jgi:large conductance mechanosensitive channel
VNSLVNDVVMPPIGLLLGGVDFSSLMIVLKEGTKAPGPYATPAQAKEALAVTINIGTFINTLINFVVVSFAVFLLVKGINAARREAPAAPAGPTSQEKLLMEIRDLLRARG